MDVALTASDWEVSILVGGPWLAATSIQVLGGDIHIGGLGFAPAQMFVRYLGLGNPVTDVHGSTLAPFGPTPL